MNLKFYFAFLFIYMIVSQPSYAQISEFKIMASDRTADDWFGISVSISGDYAVVGALFDDDNGDGSGSAYVFKRAGTTWVEEAKLLASDGTADDNFGISVSISGDYAVVGAVRNEDNGPFSGSAYVFKRTGTTWVEEAKLLPSDGTAFDQFGNSVSISGDYAVVGVSSNDDNGNNSGLAYVYNGFTSPVGVEGERVGIPAEFSLSQNHPNPFNPVTTIEFSLPAMGYTLLTIYNLRGQEIAKLVSGEIQAGYHKVNWNASNFASGIYFYRLQAGDFVQTRKMVLLK